MSTTVLGLPADHPLLTHHPILHHRHPLHHRRHHASGEVGERKPARSACARSAVLMRDSAFVPLAAEEQRVPLGLRGLRRGVARVQPDLLNVCGLCRRHLAGVRGLWRRDRRQLVIAPSCAVLQNVVVQHRALGWAAPAEWDDAQAADREAHTQPLGKG